MTDIKILKSPAEGRNTLTWEDLKNVACPHCGAVVGGYRINISDESPPQGALYPCLHNCPGDNEQVAPPFRKPAKMETQP